MVSIRILFKMRTNNPSIPKGPQWLQKKKLTLYDSARIGSAQAVLLFEIVCLSVIIAASYLLPDPYGSKRLIPCLVGSSSAVHKPHLSLSPEAPSVSPPRTRDLATIYVALQEYRHVTTPPGRPQVPSSSLLECSWGPCPWAMLWAWLLPWKRHGCPSLEPRWEASLSLLERGLQEAALLGMGLVVWQL
jgi:hypothetical protein